jgi:ankyrin repeat protein
MDFLQAANESDLEAIKSLLESGKKPDFNITDEMGMNLLSILAEQGNVDIFNVLLPHAPKDLSTITDQNNCTVLHFATLSDNLELVELIIKHSNALLTKSDSTAALPSHWACTHGYADLLPLVADKEETKSAVDKNGWTPLHFAAANNRPQCIEWLLQNGADKSIRDKSERTALDLANQRQFLDVVELLQ